MEPISEGKGKANNRIEYIDIAKFVAIFLLLIEHTGNWIDFSGGGTTYLSCGFVPFTCRCFL